MTKRAYRYRFYPTAEQAELLVKTFGCVRLVYNTLLRWRTDAFHKEQQKIGYTAVSAHLTALKKQPDLAFLNEVSCVPLQQSLRHQQSAFKNFLKGGPGTLPSRKSETINQQSLRHQHSSTGTASCFWRKAASR